MTLHNKRKTFSHCSFHLLSLNTKQLNAKDETQTTPLHWAAYHGHLPVVHCLVSCGAVLEARNKDGQTPLHWAAMGGHQLVFHLLCAAGADMRAADAHGYNAAHLAIQYGFPSLAYYAFNHGVKVDETGLQEFFSHVQTHTHTRARKKDDDHNNNNGTQNIL